MEQNLPVIAKKFWHMLRVAMFMLRKGISKSKLLSDLNMMMKRGKIAGKAIQNLMFHHSHQWVSSAASVVNRRSHDRHLFFTPHHPTEYEFSCSNSPAYPSFNLPFQLKKAKNNHHHLRMFSPASEAVEEHEYVTASAVIKALEMLQSETASPALPGFGRSPMVRQLRITDSPFPLMNVDEDSHVVDEAAENFIKKFYKDLRKQNTIAAC